MAGTCQAKTPYHGTKRGSKRWDQCHCHQWPCGLGSVSTSPVTASAQLCCGTSRIALPSVAATATMSCPALPLTDGELKLGFRGAHRSPGSGRVLVSTSATAQEGPWCPGDRANEAICSSAALPRLERSLSYGAATKASGCSGPRILAQGGVHGCLVARCSTPSPDSANRHFVDGDWFVLHWKQ